MFGCCKGCQRTDEVEAQNLEHIQEHKCHQLWPGNFHFIWQTCRLSWIFFPFHHSFCILIKMFYGTLLRNDGQHVVNTIRIIFKWVIYIVCTWYNYRGDKNNSNWMGDVITANFQSSSFNYVLLQSLGILKFGTEIRLSTSEDLCL